VEQDVTALLRSTFHSLLSCRSPTGARGEIFGSSSRVVLPSLEIARVGAEFVQAVVHVFQPRYQHVDDAILIL
jgi:hypothetical protein